MVQLHNPTQGQTSEVPNVVITDFARQRHQSGTSYSYFAGTWEQLVQIIMDNFSSWRPGYRDGVILVSIPFDKLSQFYSGIHILEKNDELTGSFKTRDGAGENEEPRIEYFAKNSKKSPAKSGYVVLYASSVLGKDASLDVNDSSNWEVVSLNISPTLEESPIDPWTLMNNHFEASGGTDTLMSDSEFTKVLQKSYGYWRNKVMCS